MYCPTPFRESRLEVLHSFICDNPLGLLISNGSNGQTANLLPFTFARGGDERGVLRAHIARSNPQWREIDNQQVLIVFRGPEAYVSPSLYASKNDSGKVVPTWNYVMVQARGRATLRDQQDWLSNQLANLTAAQEAPKPEPWAVTDAPPDYIEAQMRHIVGFEIEIAAIEGKWKVSQNQPENNRRSVVEGFARDAGTHEMAELVRVYGKVDG